MPRKRATSWPEVSAEAKPTRCELCDRHQPLTKHHLIPKAVHRRARFQKRYDKQELRELSILICRACHNGIHDLFPDEMQLAEIYNTRDALLADERMQKHVAWVKKQK